MDMLTFGWVACCAVAASAAALSMWMVFSSLWNSNVPERSYYQHQQQHQQQQYVNQTVNQQQYQQHLYASLDETLSVCSLPRKEAAPVFAYNLDSIGSHLNLYSDSVDNISMFSEADTVSLGAFSFTTSANDDFEFHDTRSVCPVGPVGPVGMSKEATCLENEITQLAANATMPAIEVNSSLAPTHNYSDFLSSGYSDNELSQFYGFMNAERINGTPAATPPSKFAKRNAIASIHKKRTKATTNTNTAENVNVGLGLGKQRNFFSTSDLQQLDYNNWQCRSRSPKSGPLTNLCKEKVDWKQLQCQSTAAFNNSNLNCNSNSYSICNFISKRITNKKHSSSTEPHILDTLYEQVLKESRANQWAKVHVEKRSPRKDSNCSQSSRPSSMHVMPSQVPVLLPMHVPVHVPVPGKWQEAFKKHNLRSSLILRQKALEKRIKKSRFKKRDKKENNKKGDAQGEPLRIHDHIHDDIHWVKWVNTSSNLNSGNQWTRSQPNLGPKLGRLGSYWKLSQGPFVPRRRSTLPKATPLATSLLTLPGAIWLH